jgi:cyclohexanone monooxygenase
VYCQICALIKWNSSQGYKNNMEKHVDVLIVGAGISGIGIAAHLAKNCPQRQFEIIERRDSLVELGIYFVILVFVLIQICRLWF